LLVERDLGIPLLLIDADSYDAPSGRLALDPDDAALLALHDAILGAGAIDSAAASSSAVAAASAAAAAAAGDTPGSGIRKRPTLSLSWLRKTEYLDHAEATPQFKAGKVERAGAAAASLQQRRANDGRDLHQLVEESFAAARRPPAHPDKPWLQAEAVYELLPADDELWKNDYYFVRFENDPVSAAAAQSILQQRDPAATDGGDEGDEPGKRARVSEADVRNYATFARTHAFLRPSRTDEGEEFLDLYLPTPAAAADASSDAPAELQLRRAYHYQVHEDMSKRFVLALDTESGVASYVPFSSRMQLRTIQKPTYGLMNTERPDVLRRSVREPTEREEKDRRRRLQAIEALALSADEIAAATNHTGADGDADEEIVDL
jgi:hypothetical protein